MHLESLDSTPTRHLQLQLVFSRLAATSHAVLLGDCNFAPSDPESESLDPDYVDAWEAVHPQEQGHTCAGRRIDWVLLKGLQVVAADLLGQQPHPHDRDPKGQLAPSDHMGLHVQCVADSVCIVGGVVTKTGT